MQSTNGTPERPVGEVEELRERIKSGALRPLADKFQQLARQIDSGDYELPKTIEEASVITEGYIDEVTDRILALIAGASGSFPTEPQVDELVYSPRPGESEGERLAYLAISEKAPNCKVMRASLARAIDRAIATATRTAVEEARVDELNRLIGDIGSLIKGETWEDWGWRVKRAIEARLAALKEQKHE